MIDLIKSSEEIHKLNSQSSEVDSIIKKLDYTII